MGVLIILGILNALGVLCWEAFVNDPDDLPPLWLRLLFLLAPLCWIVSGITGDKELAMLGVILFFGMFLIYAVYLWRKGPRFRPPL
jgi:hypothetical protein